MKKPLIRRIFSDSQYEWMLAKLPFRVMYVQRCIDSQHQMWFPRWGYTERQIEESKKKAEEWNNSINWD